MSVDASGGLRVSVYHRKHIRDHGHPSLAALHDTPTSSPRLAPQLACARAVSRVPRAACAPESAKRAHDAKLPRLSAARCIRRGAMWAVEIACRTWADREEGEVVAAVRALCRIRGDGSAIAKAVARRLRTFLVQALSNRAQQDLALNRKI